MLIPDDELPGRELVQKAVTVDLVVGQQLRLDLFGTVLKPAVAVGETLVGPT